MATPTSGGGYSINPSATGVAGLQNYLDQTNKAQALGYRGPIINIATGASKLSAPSATDGGTGSLIKYALIGGGVLIGLWIWKG
jgi:hypothetical protein